MGKELDGFNYISSMNKVDIFETLRAVEAARNSRVYIETDTVHPLEDS